MRGKNSGYLLVFSAGALWGTIRLFVKQMELGGSSPIETAFLRVFFAFLILLVICICRGGWRSLRTDCKALFVSALLGIVCHGIYNIFYSFAVTKAGVSISAVLLNIAPIFTLLCSSIFFQERFTFRKIIAIVINIIGCILTVVAYILYYQGLQRIDEPSKAPVIASIETVVATVIGIFGYHERLGIVSLLGIFLVLMSIVIMNFKEKIT